MSLAEQNNANINQTSLFGEVEDQVVNVLPDVVAWTDQERLIEEKAALGFYVSGHPYMSYKKDLQAFISTSLANISPKDKQLMAGIVSGVRVRMTGRGKMVIVGLDDGTTRQEVVVNGDLLAQHADLLKDDQLVIIEGRISNDDFSGGLRVSARKVFSLAGIRNSRASFLKISCNGQADAQKLKTILLPHRISAEQIESGEVLGGCAVKVHYHNQTSQVELMLGKTWRVDLHDELIQTLTTWLSRENVKILYN